MEKALIHTLANADFFEDNTEEYIATPGRESLLLLQWLRTEKGERALMRRHSATRR